MNTKRTEIIQLMAEIYYNEKDAKVKEELKHKLDTGLSDDEKVYLTQCLEGLTAQDK